MDKHIQPSVAEHDEQFNDGGIEQVPTEKMAREMSVVSQDLKGQNAEAKKATDREHQLTLRDSLRLYPKAVAFSLLFSTAIIMEGYDLSLLGSFYGYSSYVFS